MPPGNQSLQHLLRLRQSVERQEEMKLAAAVQRLRGAEDILKLAQDNRERDHEAVLKQMETEVSAAELQMAELTRAVASQQEKKLTKRVDELDAEREAQRGRLLERTRDRKVLDNLHERRDKRQREIEQRRIQAALDEAFLFNRHSRQ